MRIETLQRNIERKRFQRDKIAKQFIELNKDVNSLVVQLRKARLAERQKRDERIRALREKGWKFETIAEKLRVSVATVSRAVNGGESES